MIVGESVEDVGKVLVVFVLIAGIYENVVEIYYNAFVEKIIEKGVHGGLECGWCVCKAEWHDIELVSAVSRNECCLMSVWGVDRNLMIASE